jgi:hypothetical protein
MNDKTWRQIRCWVLFDHIGVPVQPLRCRLDNTADEQVVAKPQSKGKDRRRRETTLLLEKLDSLVHPKFKVAIPNLTIRTKFVEWRTTPEADAKLRKSVPILVHKTELPLPTFEAYVCAFCLSDNDHIFLAVR